MILLTSPKGRLEATWYAPYWYVRITTSPISKRPNYTINTLLRRFQKHTRYGETIITDINGIQSNWREQPVALRATCPQNGEKE